MFARAFAWHEPWGDWAMPDPSDREERIFARFQARPARALHPLRRVLDDRRRHGDDDVDPARGRGAGQPAAARPTTPPTARSPTRCGPGDELIASLKPDVEHWYLDTIATDPDLHGQGLGGRLLDHDLAIRDAAGEACALDTHTADNIAFYGRRGFEVVGEGQLRGGPPVFMMFSAGRLAPGIRPQLAVT